MRQDMPIRRLLTLRAVGSKTPITGGFELTPRCNLNCKMCYIHMSAQECAQRGRELTAAQWLDLGRQAVDAGTIFLLLTGGEPFLRPDFQEIYLGLTKLGLSVSINSNGTLIDDRVVEWLRQSPPAQINITLYGTSRETYGALCGDPTAYDRAVHAIDALREAGILVALNATVTPLNSHDMDAIAEFGAARGLRVRPTHYLFPPDRRERGMAAACERFAPETAGELSARAQWLTENRERLRSFAAAQPEGEDFELLDECIRDADVPIGCLAGSAQFWISWDGRLMPCGMMDTPSALPQNIGFAAAWREVVAETAKLRLPAQCADCSLRGACPSCAAINRCETGSTAARPDYLCRLTAAYVQTLKALLHEEAEGTT